MKTVERAWEERGEWRVMWDGETRRVRVCHSLCSGEDECVLCGGLCRWSSRENEESEKEEREKEEREREEREREGKEGSEREHVDTPRYWSYVHLVV